MARFVVGIVSVTSLATSEFLDSMGAERGGVGMLTQVPALDLGDAPALSIKAESSTRLDGGEDLRGSRPRRMAQHDCHEQLRPFEASCGGETEINLKNGESCALQCAPGGFLENPDVVCLEGNRWGAICRLPCRMVATGPVQSIGQSCTNPWTDADPVLDIDGVPHMVFGTTCDAVCYDPNNMVSVTRSVTCGHNGWLTPRLRDSCPRLEQNSGELNTGTPTDPNDISVSNGTPASSGPSDAIVP